jgi:hypothetical protein
VILDFAKQEFDVYIDGGSFYNFLLINNGKFKNQADYVDKIWISNGDAWSGHDSYAWFDNIMVNGFQENAVWESEVQEISEYYTVEDTIITFRGLK